MEATINPEYASLVRTLSESEYNELKDSIAKRGLHVPIVVNSKGEILDGHNRFKICQELGIQPAFVTKEFEDPEEEKIFVIEANIQRRQLSDFERIELVRKVEAIEKERAERRRLANLKTFADGVEESSSSNEQLEESGTVREIMAEKAGVSPTTYYRGAVVLDSGNQEVIQAVKDGKMSINKAYEKVTAKEEKATRQKKTIADVIFLPRGMFKTALDQINAAIESDAERLRITHNKHFVVGVGEAQEIEVS